MQHYSSTLIDKDTSQSATGQTANNVKDQEPTEVDRDRYYEYDLDLIDAILHNGSLAGIKNPRPRIKHSCDEVTSSRCASEELTITIDYCDQVLQFLVCNPQVGDVHHEMTAIYLSRREVHALRALLSRLQW
jgi:hypothetical protein